MENIAEIDKQGMLETVANTPEMLLDALTLAPTGSLKKSKKVKQIVLVGMGGSAIAGNIISDLIWDKAQQPVFVNRGYKLPAFVSNETLVFVLSYSGNTEETLAAVKQASELNAKIICVTSGGKLKELAESKGYPLYLIPTGYQPRAALPYLLVPVLASLELLGFPSASRQQIETAAELLKKLRGEYGQPGQDRINPIEQLATKLVGKIPVILGVKGTSGAAGLRLKTQLNENSKTTALFNIFPELNHNEIVNLAAAER
ncbi:MAG: bifunctional phosphoglucose/phosphomannose isomerase, partial [Candidatus Margulisbacteria bacterium]|nr:bifunctional phosphoglucose/phosphomannose isomerase [Candidatus Margulisiibacteriota bacterium]